MTPFGSVSIIGIDPGTETLGLSILTFDAISIELQRVAAYTFVGSRLFHYSDAIAVLHGERYARLCAHQLNLLRIFQLVRPMAIVSESPFFNPRRPAAGAALVETIDCIRGAIQQYDPYRVLQLVDPSSVKNAVGAKGNAGKDDVKKAMERLGNTLPFDSETPFASLSEHAIDSVAVAYWRYKQYQPWVPMKQPY